MRNTLIGAVLAAVLVAALFAASFYCRQPATGPATIADLPPEQMAASLKDDFVGDQKIGAWRLVCSEAKELPRSPSNGQTGNSQGTAPRDGSPPPGWRLPRCLVGLVLHNPKDPKDDVHVTFRTIGFKRVLTLFQRYAPNDVAVGDSVKASFDTTDWSIPVRSCSAQFCLAIASIKLADTATVENAKRFSIAFKPASGPAEIVLPIPTDGLGAAVKAMKRLNH